MKKKLVFDGPSLSLGIALGPLGARLNWKLVDRDEQYDENLETMLQEAIRIIRRRYRTIEDLKQAQRMDADLFNYIVEHCKTVEDKDMQALWANLIAGAWENPESFSRRVVNEVSQMSKGEAQAFTELAGYVWHQVDHNAIHLIIDGNSSLVKRVTDTNLVARGLMEQSFGQSQERGLLRYYDRLFSIVCGPSPRRMSVSLSGVGEALLPVCGGKPIPGLAIAKLNGLKEENIILEYKELFPSMETYRITDYMRADENGQPLRKEHSVHNMELLSCPLMPLTEYSRGGRPLGKFTNYRGAVTAARQLFPDWEIGECVMCSKPDYRRWK